MQNPYNSDVTFNNSIERSAAADGYISQIFPDLIAGPAWFWIVAKGVK